MRLSTTQEHCLRVAVNGGSLTWDGQRFIGTLYGVEQRFRSDTVHGVECRGFLKKDLDAEDHRYIPTEAGRIQMGVFPSEDSV